MTKKIEIHNSELRLRALIQALPDLVWLKDTSGTYLTCNSRFEQFFGAPEESIIGKTDYDFVSRELADMFRQNDQMAMTVDRPVRNEEWVTFVSDGHSELLETTKTPVRDDDGRVIGVLGIGHDITERKRNEFALTESEARFRAVFELSGDAIVLHQDGKLRLVNPAAVEMFGASSANDLIGKPILDLVHPDFHNLVIERVKDATLNGIVGTRIEEKYIKLDGVVFDVEAQSQPIVLHGRPAVVVTARDITERKALEAKMHQMAYCDALTGLPNRRMLVDRLKQAIAASTRKGQYGALMFLDIDNFKPLNDNHGHDVGDIFLIEVARRLTNCLREVDTVARFGGDEFVVLLGDIGTDVELARKHVVGVAEKIRFSLAAPYELLSGNHEALKSEILHSCSASIGATMFVDQEGTPADIIRRADAAMYQAKNDGRNVVRFNLDT